MIHHYLKTVFLFLCVFQLRAQEVTEKMVSLYPFEDYSNCTTGFLDASSWPRDTIYPAKFDFVSEIGDIFNLDSHRNYSISNWIVSEKGKFGCLSQDNKWFLDCLYDSLNYDFYANQFIVKQKGKIGTLNLQKQTVFPFEFDEIYTEAPVTIGFYTYLEGDWFGNWIDEIFARKNGLTGVYDKNAKEIIAPGFDSIQAIYFHPGFNYETDTISKRFYKVKKNNRFGLFNSAGKLLIPVQYAQLNSLYSGQFGKNILLFSVTDSLGQHSVMDETGKQLVPFSKMEYKALITNGTKQELETARFVSETDPGTDQQRITMLGSGKSSKWYPKAKLVGDWIWVKSDNRWLVLDSNFKECISQSNPNDRLYYFDSRQGLNSTENILNDSGSGGSWYYWGINYSIQPVFVIERESSDKKQFGLINVSTGKRSSVSYDQVIRMAVDSTYYYWCFYDAKEFSSEEDDVSVDICNETGKLVNTIRIRWNKELLINPYREYVYNSEHGLPYMRTPIADGKYTIHGIDGWQPKFHEFEDKLMSVYKLNESKGNLHFVDESDKHYFTDFNGKPLMNGLRYETRSNAGSSKWILDLKDGPTTLFINEKLEILLDSCEDVKYNVHYLKINYTDNYERDHIFAIRKGYVYWVDKYKLEIKLVDAKMFSSPDGMNEIASGFYVDDSGKKISEEEVQRRLKAEKVKANNSWFWIENGELKIEDAKHQLIQVIPNVRDYKYQNVNSFTVFTNDNKEGLIDSEGNWILEPLYEHIFLTDGYWPSLFFARDKQFDDTLWFAINQKGEPLTKAIFNQPFEFKYGDHWSYAYSNKKIGIVDRNLKWVTEPVYIDARLVNGVIVLKGSDHYAIVDAATGKSFLAPQDSVTRIDDKYLFFFDGFVQVLDLQGKELLPATKISALMNSKSFGELLYERDDYYHIPRAMDDHLEILDSNAFLIRLNNQLIIENARYNAVALKQIGGGWRYEYYTDSECSRSAVFINKYAYSEKVEGDCYEHPENLYRMNWKYSYRTYWIRNNSLVQIKKLSDLFKEGSDYDSLLDKLIAEQIQANQTFGVACANVPAAVVEFKRNFYLNGHNMGFIYYDVNDNYYVEIDLNVLESVLKPELK